jgi:DNA polymerase-3 subunit alpha
MKVAVSEIDIDVSPSDRDKVYEYIINRFGQEKTAYILAIDTTKDKGFVDDVCRALSIKWERENCEDERPLKARIAELRGGGENLKRNKDEISVLTKQISAMKARNEAIKADNPWTLKLAASIKNLYDSNPDEAKSKYPEVFYYFDGLVGTAVSQSMHSAGIVASPITLRDNYGTFISDGKEVLQIDMDCVHEVSLVKYDILG